MLITPAPFPRTRVSCRGGRSQASLAVSRETLVRTSGCDEGYSSPALKFFQPYFSGVAWSTGQKPTPGCPLVHVESAGAVYLSTPFRYALMVFPDISTRITSPSTGTPAAP